VRIWEKLRHEIIQDVIDVVGATHYLEVGTQTAATFGAIKVDRKVGVDPDPWAEARAIEICRKKLRQNSMVFECKSSDQFFNQNSDDLFGGGFDVIFIDGMHEREQWKRDIKNSLKVLNPGGMIIAHDCNPPDERSQVVPPLCNGEWVGDVWKGWVDLRQEFNVDMFVVDTDFGVGIINPSIQAEPVSPINRPISYSMLKDDRKEMLNLVSIKEYTKWIVGLYGLQP